MSGTGSKLKPWVFGLGDLRNVVTCDFCGHDVFVPQKDITIPYYSVMGSHFGVYFDRAKDVGIAGIDQLHIFGTRWNVIGGWPLRVMLYDAANEAVYFGEHDRSCTRSVDYYPHAVLSRIESHGFVIEQVMSFVATDRLAVRMYLHVPDNSPPFRLLAAGGRAGAGITINGARRTVTFTYPPPGEDTAHVQTLHAVHPVSGHVVHPKALAHVQPLSTNLLATVLTAAGRKKALRLKKRVLPGILTNTRFAAKVTREPADAYLAYSDVITPRAPSCRQWDFLIEFDYERRPRRPAPVSFAREVKAAAGRWKRLFGKLPRVRTTADRELMRRAAIYLETQQWEPVHGFKPYISTHPSKGWYGGHWLWDSCFHAMGYMEYDAKLAKDQLLLLVKYQDPETGNIPIDMREYDPPLRPSRSRLDVEKSLYVCSQPPLIAWAAWHTFLRDRDKKFLRRIYGAVRAFARRWDTARLVAKPGLYRWDTEDPRVLSPGNESGWDNSPRWDDGGNELAAIDLNCYIANQRFILADIAEALGRTRRAGGWRAEAERLAGRINELMWDPDQGCYTDVRLDGSGFSRTLSPAMFLPMWAGIAPKDRAREMVCRYLRSSKHFWPSLPTVSFSDPRFDPEDYWRGPTWMNVAYLVLCGLHRYDYAKDVRGIRSRLLEMIRSNPDIGEYYNSITGRNLGRQQFPWTSAIAIKLLANDYCC